MQLFSIYVFPTNNYPDRMKINYWLVAEKRTKRKKESQYEPSRRISAYPGVEHSPSTILKLLESRQKSWENFKIVEFHFQSSATVIAVQNGDLPGLIFSHEMCQWEQMRKLSAE